MKHQKQGRDRENPQVISHDNLVKGMKNSLLFIRRPGADPGYPVGGGANPPGGAPTYDFAKFREKLHEIENILGRGGARAGRAPLNPPLEALAHNF